MDENKSKLDNNLEVQDLQIIDPKDVDQDKLAAAGRKHNVDLLYIRFKLCHEGANANKDAFIRDELEENFDTALFKPINWEHNKHQIIGCIYDVQFINPIEDDNAQANEQRSHIVCDAVIYKYQFPVKAEIVKDRFSKGNLSFSMETWFNAAECSECGDKFESSQDYCEHLNNRSNASSTTNRILRGITFGAAGIVKNPADVDAIGLSVAKDEVGATLSDDMIGFMVSDIQTFDDMSAILDGFVNKFKNDDLTDQDKLDEKVKDLFTKFVSITDMKESKGDSSMSDTKTFTQEEVDALIAKAVSAAKEEMDQEGKLSEIQTELQSKENEVSDLKEELERAQNEFAEFKEEIEKEKKIKARLSELTSLDIKLSDERLKKIEAQLSDMSDDAFAVFKDSMVEIAKTVAEESEEEDSSDEDKDEDSSEEEEDKTEASNIASGSFQIPNIANEDSKNRIERASSVIEELFSSEEDKN